MRSRQTCLFELLTDENQYQRVVRGRPLEMFSGVSKCLNGLSIGVSVCFLGRRTKIDESLGEIAENEGHQWLSCACPCGRDEPDSIDEEFEWSGEAKGRA